MPDDSSEDHPAVRSRPDRSGTGPAFLSPVVRRLVAEHGLDPSSIRGTGAHGRVTRDDVLAFVQAAPVAHPSVDEIVPFDTIRRRTAEHMVLAKATAAHAHAVALSDYEAVERVRRAYGASWREEEGFGLTYLPFVARAVVDALHDFPLANATVGEDALVVHHAVHLGIAVDLDYRGLVVPVLRDADDRRFRAIAREIVALAARARSRKLSPDDLTGGTFTITNPGSLGTFLSVPVINHPQVAILSTDGVAKRPVAVPTADGGAALAIHAVGMLTLGFDHRAIDGAYATAFLARVRELLAGRRWEDEL